MIIKMIIDEYIVDNIRLSVFIIFDNKAWIKNYIKNNINFDHYKFMNSNNDNNNYDF